MSMEQYPFDYHFSDIAHDYRALRFTDPEPVSFIQERLETGSTINGIELGCGTGRYTAALLAALGENLSLQCVDASAEMLTELDRRASGDYEGQYTTVHGTGEEVELAPGVYDAVLSFNALHHFKLPRVLRNIVAWLRPGGLAFLYTRTPSQNARNLWGRYFPGFAEKEDRLKDRSELLAAVDATRGLRCDETKRFAYPRHADLDTILHKADHFHYSTFRLYRKDELEAARRTFVERLADAYPDPDDIRWTDYNLMLVAEKHEEERASFQKEECCGEAS